MTKRRGIYLIFFVIGIFALFFVSNFFYKQYLEKQAIEQERLAMEEEQRVAEEAAQELRNKLISGDVNDENLKIVFLTFDDGPDLYSDEILDILQANNVQATFFTNGRTSEEYQQIYQRIVDEGHVLANHTWSHDYSIYKDVDTFIDDVESLAETQEEVTGLSSSMVFRFPGGSPNANQECIDALYDLGYSYFDWNVQNGDGLSNVLTADESYEKIIDGVHENSVSVVLLHAERPNKDGSRESLDSIIKTLQEEGYTFMALDPEYNLARFTQPTGVDLPIIPDPGLED